MVTPSCAVIAAETATVDPLGPGGSADRQLLSNAVASAGTVITIHLVVLILVARPTP